MALTEQEKDHALWASLMRRLAMEDKMNISALPRRPPRLDNQVFALSQWYDEH
ncbi:unnamed protein product, partial [Symbiodinium sp. CCMP2592]